LRSGPELRRRQRQVKGRSVTGGVCVVRPPSLWLSHSRYLPSLISLIWYSHHLPLFGRAHHRTTMADAGKFPLFYRSFTISHFLFLSGFFKGTSADQDRRFSDKELKLLKSIKFPPQFDTKVTRYHHRSYLSSPRVTPLGRYAQGQFASHSALGR
jgi:hypothetical protein